MESIRDHKLFHREDLNEDMILKVLHKVTIKIRLLGTVEAEKQDAPISLLDILIQRAFYQDIKKIFNKN